MKTLGLYLHIPFCVQKCHYCDFLSAPATNDRISSYVNTLIKEIREKGKIYKDYSVDTIFFGGGTPSILKVAMIKDIMSAIKMSFQVLKDAEITMECNPGTVNMDSLQGIRSAGINRLSFGLQSTDDEDLKRLGRIHTFEVFLKCYQEAREVGFDNINIDLMTSLPGQNLQSFMASLKKVVALQPEHLSVYSLIIEEGTLLYRWYEEEDGNLYPPLPNEEEDRKIYHETLRFLRQHGYERYEISNYAKPTFASRHNMKYWDRSEYLGLGLGASSMVSDIRWHETNDIEEYISGNFEDKDIEKLSTADCMSEYMFLGLRMMKGVSLSKFETAFHVKLYDQYGEVIEKHLKNGLLEEFEGALRLTEKGIDISNYVMSDFV